MKIKPAKRLVGIVRVPGDKSISHRAVMLASIAEGVTRITNFAAGQDCMSTVECMRTLGVRIDVHGTDVTVHGVGKYGLRPPEQPLDCGNSGTTMRLLAGILAGQAFDAVLVGDGSLSKRPMKRILDPLRQMGAVIESSAGQPPLKINGRARLNGITYDPPIASAQVKSCVLLAGLYASGETSINETVTTRDHTERMLDYLIDPDGGLRARPIDVPGDISSAAYFIVSAGCRPGSEVQLENVGINPTRAGLLNVLERSGIGIDHSNPREMNNEPVADLRVANATLNNETIRLSGSTVAEMIDEIPILAVLGTQLDGGIEVRGAGELRVKESDRINSIVGNLMRMRADVTEYEDGFRVRRSHLKGTVVNSFGDHRIAMAFTIAGLLAAGETEIRDADCAAVSYPGFYEDLAFVARYE